jgi:hypothetical protein
MDHHVIALFALTGMGLDLLGGLFLAYDLFGRRGGPLRTLLRAILYCFIFIAVCSIALDWRFAVVAGIGIGLTLTYELGRTASAVERATRAQERFGLFSFERQQISLVLLRGFSLGQAPLGPSRLTSVFYSDCLQEQRCSWPIGLVSLRVMSLNR